MARKKTTDNVFTGIKKPVNTLPSELSKTFEANKNIKVAYVLGEKWYFRRNDADRYLGANKYEIIKNPFNI